MPPRCFTFTQTNFTMKKKPHPQPHDLLFAEVFSRTEVAASFFKNFAGDELPMQKLKLETLRLEPSSYVKPDLKRFYSDLVFSCEYGKASVEISIIKEHKSTPPVAHISSCSIISAKNGGRKQSKRRNGRPSSPSCSTTASSIGNIGQWRRTCTGWTGN